jgi:diguanylate cyclase (GGDEF)-like protein
MLLTCLGIMENTTQHPTSETNRDLAREKVAAGHQVRGRLLGIIAVTSFALLAIFAIAFSSCTATASASGQSGGFFGGRGLSIFMAMLMGGGAFVVLRAAISHDEFSRRLDGLCRDLESNTTRLKEFSFKDEVTSLYNRRFFGMRLEDEVSRYCRFNQPLSVVMLDIDGFKAVNDELGHAAGDETLRTVGDILQRQSRSIDVICRYGGDEFAVLLVETGRDGALRYAERIRRHIEGTVFGHGRSITVSLGVACLPDDVGPMPDDIVTAADWALYDAKRAGKNQVAGRDGAVAIGRGRRGGWDL